MSDELKGIFETDQGERENTSEFGENDWKALKANDESRMKRVRELLSLDLLKTGADYYRAAMVFQHGSTEEDYVTANELAFKSMELNHEPAKWLYAASLDRLMLEQGKPYQKFGTQFQRKTINDPWELLPVDPNTTDEERAKYNVPTLAEQKKKEAEYNSEN